jgi:glycosyltransferase involved in cell wall biosynthesis
MKIAVDSGPLSNGHSVRGIGTYTRELTKHLKVYEKKVKGLHVDLFDFAKDQRLLHTGYDVVHFTTFNPFTMSLPEKLPNHSVVTIHDFIPFLYPKHYPSGVKGAICWYKQKEQLKKMSAIIVNSETTKKDVVRFTGISQSDIFVTHLASRTQIKKISKLGLSKIRIKYKLPQHFVLYVGDVNYNKNITSLIKACGIVNIPLVICGKSALEIGNVHKNMQTKGVQDTVRNLLGMPHPERSHEKEIIDALKENPNVIRLGFVEDNDLANIYNIATIYCQPSYYEGFGIPVCEAQICGIPVVCSKTQALVEVTKDTALYFDPYDVDDMALKISSLIDDYSLRSQKAREGLKNASNYSWMKTTLSTLAVYKSVSNTK